MVRHLFLTKKNSVSVCVCVCACIFWGSYLARTDPADVARVESKTYVCTERKEDAVPTARTGVEGTLGNWKAPGVMDEELGHKFHGCMTGE